MRYVIFGAGAIGGVVGARLHQSGHEVVLIARGAHHDAIARGGLTLETPVERVTLPIEVADGPGSVAFTDEDVVLLSVKSQDTAGALLALRDAAPDAPIVCLQNGVANERLALRLFERVYGAVVMSPTAHLEPGVVQSFGTVLSGVIDLGRFPGGSDELAATVARALASSHFSSEPRVDIMRFKHAKLLGNLGNAVELVCGGTDSAEADRLDELAREEGRAAMRAAGIEFVADEVNDIQGRWETIGVQEIAGRERVGSSTWQSVVRGTGAVETDYINGEIVLIGRLTGVPTPVNALLQRLARETVRDRHSPGWLAPAVLLAGLS
jgi:2-dehydropantoate 2-reductase